MFDTLFIITLFLLASFLVLFTYFKIEHQYYYFMPLFSFITDIDGFFEIPSPFLRLFWPTTY